MFPTRQTHSYLQTTTQTHLCTIVEARPIFPSRLNAFPLFGFLSSLESISFHCIDVITRIHCFSLYSCHALVSLALRLHLGLFLVSSSLPTMLVHICYPPNKIKRIRQKVFSNVLQSKSRKKQLQLEKVTTTTQSLTYST